jgi:glutamine synthetase
MGEGSWKKRFSNFKTTPEALKARASKQALDLFSGLGIMNHVEVEARYEIELEEYTKKIQIEGRVLGDINKSRNSYCYSLPKFDRKRKD